MLEEAKNLWKHRVLIQSLVIRELKARYRGSVLGFLWSFLNPLLLMVVYSLVFSVYLRFGMKNYSVFLFCGLLPWLWFSSSVIEGTNSIMTGSALIKKVLFPAEILPITVVLSNLLHFLFGLPILFIFLFAAKIYLGVSIIVLPIVIVIQLIFTVALVLILASLSVHFRDISQIMNNLITLWFFLCPIIYSIDQVKSIAEKYVYTFKFNPMALIIMAYQDILFKKQFPNWYDLLGVLIFSLILLVISYHIFNKMKHSFAEEV